MVILNCECLDHMVLSYLPCSLAGFGVALCSLSSRFGRVVRFFVWPWAVLFGLAVCLPPCLFSFFCFAWFACLLVGFAFRMCPCTCTH